MLCIHFHICRPYLPSEKMLICVYFQLYIALQRKTKNRLTGVAMETMRASAPVNLERIETGLYQQVKKILFDC